MAKRNVEIVISAKDQASRVMKGFGKALIGIAAAAGVAFIAFKKFSDFLKQALDNAVIQERAELKLAGALSTLGQNTKEVRQEMAQFASELQDKFAIADDVILDAMANIAGLGELSGKELERATLATVALTAASGDMAGNAIIMSKAVAGMASSLGRYIGTLDPALSETEKMALAFRIIEKRLAPLAVALGQTMDAALKKVKFAYGDVIDAIGMAIFNTEQFGETLAFVTEKLKELEQFVKDNEKSLREFGASGAETFALLAEASVKLAKGLILVVQSQRALFAIHSGNVLVIGELIEQTKRWLAPVEALDNALDGLQERLEKFREAGAKPDVAEAIGNIVTTTGKAVDEFEKLNELAKELGTSSIPQMREQAEQVAQFISEINAALLRGVITAAEFAFLQDEALDIAERLAEAGIEVEVVFGRIAVKAGELTDEMGETERMLAAGVAKAAADVGGALVDAAFGARIEWKKFFVQMLNDLARMIVQALIWRTVMGAFGVPGFQSGGEVPAGSQRGGRVHGGRTGQDSVLALLTPGEVILPVSLKEDFAAISDLGKAIRSGNLAGGGTPAAGGSQIQMFNTFQGPTGEDQVIEIMEVINEAVGRKGFTLKASEIVS